MITKSLEQICDLITDGTHYTPPDFGSGFPFLTVKDMTCDGLDFQNCSYVEEAEFEKARHGNCSPVRGDVLFSKDGTVGKIHVVRETVPFAVLSSIAILRPNHTIVDSGYLGHMLGAPATLAQAASLKTGSALRRIVLSDLRKIKIPLPSLPEQKRIAAILDKADAIRRKRQQAVKLTEELLRSVFLDMFGDPVENAKKWPLMQIGKAIKAIETGWSANSEDRPRERDDWAVLKISSVTSGRFLPEECKVVAEDQIDRDLLSPKRGDLLFSRANTRELVAATCLVEQDEPKLFLPDKLWKIIPDEEITCSEYLRYLLTHPRFREKLTKQATGTSGSMLNISQAKVRGIEMPVPPIKLQKQFADFVWRNYNIRNKLEVASQSSNTLFNAILQRAFKSKQ